MAQSPFAAGGPLPQGQNPYQSPGDYPLGTPDESPSAITSTVLDFNDIFTRTWEIFKLNLGACVLGWFVFFVISLGIGIAYGIFVQFLAVTIRDFAVVTTINIAGRLILQLFVLWLEIGMSVYYLKIARGQPAEISDLFAGGAYFLPILLGKILFTIVTLLGSLLCIVPGIIFALMFFQYYYLIIERNAGVIDAFGQSAELTRGSRLTVLGLVVVVWLLSIPVIVCTCGFGILLVGPFSALLFAVMYLVNTGQPTADRLRYLPPTLR